MIYDLNRKRMLHKNDPLEIIGLLRHCDFARFPQLLDMMERAAFMLRVGKRDVSWAEILRQIEWRLGPEDFKKMFCYQYESRESRTERRKRLGKHE